MILSVYLWSLIRIVFLTGYDMRDLSYFKIFVIFICVFIAFSSIHAGTMRNCINSELEREIREVEELGFRGLKCIVSNPVDFTVVPGTFRLMSGKSKRYCFFELNENCDLFLSFASLFIKSPPQTLC